MTIILLTIFFAIVHSIDPKGKHEWPRAKARFEISASPQKDAEESNFQNIDASQNTRTKAETEWHLAGIEKTSSTNPFPLIVMIDDISDNKQFVAEIAFQSSFAFSFKN